MVSEAFSLLIHYKNDTTTYNAKIKKVVVNLFATDGADKERNN